MKIYTRKIDAIHAVKQIIGKAQEYNIDFKQAFDLIKK